MSTTLTVPEEIIASRIHVVRGAKVMLDSDLAQLYGVPTKQLNQQVRRNPERFPSDFMFELTAKELSGLRSQFVTAKASAVRGGRRTMPLAFTEHGVLMLSSVLNSERAIQINIHIMRVFIRLGRSLASDAGFGQKLEQLEGRLAMNEGAIHEVMEHVDRLGQQREQPRRRLGYRGGDDV